MMLTQRIALLLSANACLESHWYDSLQPCTALQISRNFRLLQDNVAVPELSADYQRLAQIWLQRYDLCNRKLKRADK